MLHGHAAESGWITVVGKGAIAIVSIKRVHLAGEGGNHQVRQTIVVVVREVYSHACVGVALAIHRDAGAQRNFLECAIAFVVVKKFGYGVVGHKDVQMAVPIVIGESNAQPLARLRKAYFVRNFSEVAVAIVVIHQWGNRVISIRMAIRTVTFSALATPGVVKVPLQVSKYD